MIAASELTERVTVTKDDATGGFQGTRGTRTPSRVTVAEGWARVVFKRGGDPLTLGGQGEPEQEVHVRMRPSVDRSLIKPGMRLVWLEVEHDIIAVQPVLRTPDKKGRWTVVPDVDLVCVERRASRREG